MYGSACLLLLLPLFTTTVKAAAVDETLKLTKTMALNCVYPGPSQIEQATWSKSGESQKKVIAVFNRQHGTIIHEPYKGRVTFVNTPPDSKDKSLFINWTLPVDVGLHYCTVQAFPDGSWEKKIQITEAGNVTYSMAVFTIGGGALCILLLVTFAIIVIVRCMHKNKERERKIRMVKSNAQHPNQTRLANSYGRGHSSANNECGQHNRQEVTSTAIQKESIYANCLYFS